MSDHIMVRAQEFEAQAAKYREALWEIARKSREYAKAGNGQSRVIYDMAMDALGVVLERPKLVGRKRWPETKRVANSDNMERQ